MKKFRGKIMTALGLDKDSHNISIVYHASQQLVNTQIFYNSIQLLCEDDVDMMLVVIKQKPQFIASDLYVTIEAVRFNVGEGSQHTSGSKCHNQYQSMCILHLHKTPLCPTMFNHVMKMIWIILMKLKCSG